MTKQPHVLNAWPISGRAGLGHDGRAPKPSALRQDARGRRALRNKRRSTEAGQRVDSRRCNARFFLGVHDVGLSSQHRDKWAKRVEKKRVAGSSSQGNARQEYHRRDMKDTPEAQRVVRQQQSDTQLPSQGMLLSFHAVLSQYSLQQEEVVPSKSQQQDVPAAEDFPFSSQSQ